ncbi:hypothetical protein [Methylobacterium isbiliense]|jgi:hypothetical protein|uniref:Uncharacterized protein n=1 Tax=Methylobacterium isbiliense TaxID=315478 RepID=A0ABQ4SMY7_9HYPH|nr:hypothetical protein [Methylobacterium isbiliense]MDN3623675.1 hypothetical protein [Methylobacterium isbiliense]GJE03099.1 hypothetical protein GMJLKIPL_5050 [Methylobacterium isbiliense]
MLIESGKLLALYGHCRGATVQRPKAGRIGWHALARNAAWNRNDDTA